MRLYDHLKEASRLQGLISRLPWDKLSLDYLLTTAAYRVALQNCLRQLSYSSDHVSTLDISHVIELHRHKHEAYMQYKHTIQIEQVKPVL